MHAVESHRTGDQNLSGKFRQPVQFHDVINNAENAHRERSHDNSPGGIRFKEGRHIGNPCTDEHRDHQSNGDRDSPKSRNRSGLDISAAQLWDNSPTQACPADQRCQQHGECASHNHQQDINLHGVDVSSLSELGADSPAPWRYLLRSVLLREVREPDRVHNR